MNQQLIEDLMEGGDAIEDLIEQTGTVQLVEILVAMARNIDYLESRVYQLQQGLTQVRAITHPLGD